MTEPVSASPLYPRIEVLKPLVDLLKSISPNVFTTSRPSSVSEQLGDYIVLKLPNGIRDRADTYQTSIAHVYLFVRDRAGEVENAWRLDEMMNALCAMCPIRHPRFTADRPVYLGGASDAGFHYIRIQLSVTINKRNLAIEDDSELQDGSINPEPINP